MQQNVIEGAEKHFLQNFVRRADCIGILKECLKVFERIEKRFQKIIPNKLQSHLNFVRILGTILGQMSRQQWNSQTILKQIWNNSEKNSKAI